MREWNAQAYRVMVVDDGFAWNGKTYDRHSRRGNFHDFSFFAFLVYPCAFELAAHLRAISRRIASKIAKVLHHGKQT